MQRVLIIGCSGSGKSTLARKLAAIAKLPIIYLDQHYFSPNWVETPKAEWEQKIRQLIGQEQWVMDGNYGGTLDQRLERADTIIYLDLPTWLCLYRILSRWIQYRGQVRPGSAPECEEKMDWEFIHYVLTFRIRRRSILMKKLNALKAEKKVVVLNNTKAVAAFEQLLMNEAVDQRL